MVEIGGRGGGGGVLWSNRNQNSSTEDFLFSENHWRMLGEGDIIRFGAEWPPGRGFPGGPSGKEPACLCRRHKRCRSDPWVRKTPGGEHGNPLQYPCLENPMDRAAWWVHRVTKSQHNWSDSAHTSTHSPWGSYLKCKDQLVSGCRVSGLWILLRWVWVASFCVTVN